MRSLRFKVEYGDGKAEEVEVWPVDLDRFEDAFKVNALLIGQEPLTFKQLAWLAHAAQTHNPDPELDRDKWLATVRDLTVVVADEPAGAGPLGGTPAT